MTRPTYLPNLLSSLRIALAPAILGAAYSNSRVGFTLLVAMGFATDAVDGFLARRWAAETPLGRRLDRWGDVLTLSLSAAGVALIWPNEIEREWFWVFLALAGYAADAVRRFVQADTAAATGWTLKALSWLVPLALVALLAWDEARPLRVAAVWQFVAGGVRLLRGRKANGVGEAARAGAHG